MEGVFFGKEKKRKEKKKETQESRLKIVTIGHKLHKDACDKLSRCMYLHDLNVNANHGKMYGCIHANTQVTKQIHS